MVELEGALSTCVVAVADADLAVLGPSGRAGGILCRLPAHAAGRRRPSGGLRPVQGAQKRLYAQLPRPLQLPVPGKSLSLLFSLIVLHRVIKVEFKSRETLEACGS